MKASQFVTTEGVFSVVGGLWFLLSAVFPVIPAAMPLPTLIPGLTEITPGLLVGISLVPILLKVFTPGRTPFVAPPASAAPKDGGNDAP